MEKHRKTILVTGGTGLVGLEIVRDLYENGYSPLIITSKVDKEAKDFLNATGFESISTNLLKSDFLDDITSAIKGREIYGFIHGARDLRTLTVGADGVSADADIIQEFQLSVLAAYKITMKLFRGYNLRRVILLSSQYGLVTPTPSLYSHGLNECPIQYGLAKAAQIQLGRELASRLSVEGVNVNTIVLGGVKGRATDDFESNYSNMVPLGRMLEANEVCSTVRFLLDQSSTAICGASIHVDGGWTIR